MKPVLVKEPCYLPVASYATLIPPAYRTFTHSVRLGPNHSVTWQHSPVLKMPAASALYVPLVISFQQERAVSAKEAMVA